MQYKLHSNHNISNIQVTHIYSWDIKIFWIWIFIILHVEYSKVPYFLFVGLQIHDTCSQEDITRRHLYHIISVATRDGLGASVRGPAHNVRPSTASSILVGDSDRGSSWVASNTSQLGVKGWMELSRGWTPPLLGRFYLLQLYS